MDSDFTKIPNKISIGNQILQVKTLNKNQNEVEINRPVDMYQQNGFESSFLYQLSTFSGPLIAIALTSLVCFIPYHNPMEESEYWYEFHILVQVWMPFHIGTTMLYGKYFANFKYDKILTSYLFIYGFGLASYLIIVAVYYYVWTYINGLKPPMPWTYYFGGFMPLCVAFFANWFRLEELRFEDPEFKKRFLWYIAILFVPLTIAAWGYLLLGTCFAIIPIDYQWTLGLVLPIVREFNIWLLTEVSYRAAGSQSRGSRIIKFTCSHFMETRHAIFAAIMIGNATDATVYSIIIIDFAINIFHGMKIVHTLVHAVSPEDHQNMEESIQRLIMTERIETIIPLTYILLMSMAYLSPNAGSIGGIKLNLWHYPAITDFGGLLQNLSLLFAIDLLSFIINGLILWKFCGANLFKVLQKLQKDFWFFMAIVEATLFVEVFFALLPGSAMDLTLQFAWSNSNGTMIDDLITST